MTEKWYIAGPFFNEPQRELIQEIEETFIDCGVPFFSPRLCAENSPGRKLTDEDARTIFDRNIDNLAYMDGFEFSGSGTAWQVREYRAGVYKACTHMLAVPEFRLPLDCTLHVLKGAFYGGNRIEGKEIARIEVPDSGTVWEMGFAYALSIPCLLFCETPPKKVNVMLSQSTQGLLVGFDKLRTYLREQDHERRHAFLEKYKGEHV